MIEGIDVVSNLVDITDIDTIVSISVVDIEDKKFKTSEK